MSGHGFIYSPSDVSNSTPLATCRLICETETSAGSFINGSTRPSKYCTSLNGNIWFPFYSPRILSFEVFAFVVYLVTMCTSIGRYLGTCIAVDVLFMCA
jgi:hypothetical protein